MSRRGGLSLRARFVFLIVGSVIVPPVVFALSGLAAIALNIAPDATSSVIVMRDLLRLSSTGRATVDALAREIDTLLEKPASSRMRRVAPHVYLIDSDGTLRAPVSRAGDTATLSAIVAEATAADRQYVNIVPVPGSDGGTGYLVLASDPHAIAVRIFQFSFVSPLVLLVFLATMSIVIIRSINASISRLESATRQIATGDLDFQLTADGSDALASLTRSFESMRLRLKEQLDRSARFLMGISHDLRTPLASITGYIGAIRDGHADTPQRLERYAEIIDAKARLLESRITSLIDYARQETSEWKTTLTEVDAAAFFGEAIDVAGAEATARGFRCEPHVDIPAGTTIRLDPGMISRALENLVDNAFRYTPAGGTIGLSARADGERLLVCVSNSGPGIGAADLPNIFLPLYRAAGDRKGSGFGLGLSIVRSVIGSHGWEIDVTSSPGDGTIFTVTVPLVPS